MTPYQQLLNLRLDLNSIVTKAIAVEVGLRRYNDKELTQAAELVSDCLSSLKDATDDLHKAASHEKKSRTKGAGR